MVDLNTLISPRSGMQLTLAETINDHGEIAVNGTPSGCGIVEQCGHAVLLIPCDEHHPGVEGCDYSVANTLPAAARTRSAVRNSSNRMLSPQLLRPMNRYRFPSPAFGPRN